MNGFEKLVCSLGGADIAALVYCPSDERKKFFLSGIINILGSCCSAAIMALALSTFQVEKIWLFSIAIFWGIFCFLLTKSICGTILSGAKAVSSIALRLIVTVILPLFTSTIIETMVFTDFLTAQLREREMIELREGEAKSRERLAALEDEIGTWYAQINDQLAGDPRRQDLSAQHETAVGARNTTLAQNAQWIQGSNARIASMHGTRSLLVQELANLPADSERRFGLNSQIQTINTNIAWETTEQARRRGIDREREAQVAATEQAMVQRTAQVEGTQNARLRDLYARREAEAATVAEFADLIQHTSESNHIYGIGGLIGKINLIRQTQGRIFDPTATQDQRFTAWVITFVGVIIAVFFITLDMLPLLTLSLYKSPIYDHRKEKQRLELERIYEEEETQRTFERQQKTERDRAVILAKNRIDEMLLEKKAEDDMARILVESEMTAIELDAELEERKWKEDIRHRMAEIEYRGRIAELMWMFSKNSATML